MGRSKDRPSGNCWSSRRNQMLGKLAGRFRRFPVLLKFLDAREKLSVQVHPEDGQTDYIPAGESGKSEAWVVLEAGPKSRIYAGLKPGTTRDDLERALASRAVADLLAGFTPRVGDAVFVQAGTVHSLGDVVVFEVQENSDVTFRLYDWDRVDPKYRQASAAASRAGDGLHRSRASRDRSGGARGGGDDAPARRERLFHCRTFHGVAAHGRIAVHGRRGGYAAGLGFDRRRRGAGARWAPIIPSAAATSCSCRRRSAHVLTGPRQAVSIAGSRAAGIVPEASSRTKNRTHSMKKLVVFDLDGTLAQSKASH